MKIITDVFKLANIRINRVIWIIVCLIISAFLSALSPGLMMQLIDGVLSENKYSLFWGYILIYILVLFLTYIFRYIANRMCITFGNTMVAELRLNLVNKIQSLSGDFFCNSKAGNLSLIIYEDTSIIKNLITSSFFSVISDLCITVPISIYIIFIQPSLLIGVILLQPVIYIIQVKYSTAIYSKSTICRKSASSFGSIIQEFVSILLPLSIANGFNFFKKRIKKSSDELKIDSEDLELTYANRNMIMNILSIFWTAFVLGYGGFKVLDEKISLGALIVLLQYSSKLFSPIMTITTFLTDMQRSIPSLERVNGILDMETSIVHSNGSLVNNNWNIVFRDVSFTYDNKRDVLKYINMNIPASSKIAIVGESGSGKSTLINLIQKLWPLKTGTIMIGNHNIVDLNTEYIRNNIGVVTHNSILINSTIKENILWDKINVDDEKIWQILKIVELQEFVSNLPDKLNSIIGDKGITISGGQRQRIEIARVLLRDTPVLIFDEATSSLDNVIEKRIIDRILTMYYKKTIIIITHRLDKIKWCDKIYVIKNGEIIEKGNHEELYMKEGEYFRLYNSMPFDLE